MKNGAKKLMASWMQEASERDYLLKCGRTCDRTSGTLCSVIRVDVFIDS